MLCSYVSLARLIRFYGRIVRARMNKLIHLACGTGKGCCYSISMLKHQLVKREPHSYLGMQKGRQ